MLHSPKRNEVSEKTFFQNVRVHVHATHGYGITVINSCLLAQISPDLALKTLNLRLPLSPRQIWKDGHII